MEKIDKTDILICICEVSICLIGGTLAKILIQLLKNIIRIESKSIDTMI